MPKKPLSIALLFVTAVAAGTAMAHSGDEPPIFVASDGVDEGNCQSVTDPCRSIGYALSKVGKGGEIRVASGNYIVDDPEDLFYLVGGTIEVQGGYDRGTFLRPATGASTLIGVPPAFAAAISQRGFHVIADRKALDRDTATQLEQKLAVHASLKSSMPATPCTGGSVNGLPCANVDLLSHVAQADISAQPGDAADVWGFMDLNTNREYAIVGFDIGTAIFDVTDAENPREVGFIDGQPTIWRDIKVFQFWNASEDRWNAHAYITTDGSSVTDGLFVVDLSGLPHSVSRLNYNSDFLNAHNVYATSTDFGTGLTLSGTEPTIIVAGSNNNQGPYRAYSVGNPASPQFEAMPGSGRNDYMHDAASMIITDSRKDTQCVNATTYCELLFDFNELTFDIWDITNTNSPVRLSRTNYPNVAYVHSGWWSEDKQFLFVHDELDESDFGLLTTLRVYSLADLTAPVTAGPGYLGPTTAIDHNGFVRGNRYYMSNYTRGLTILDITDAGSPTLAGRIDTFPGSDSVGFAGAWGTYPFLPSGNIAISDIETGLYMVADRTLDVDQGKLAFSASSFGADEGTQAQLTVSRSFGAMGAVSVGVEIVPVSGSDADVTVTNTLLSWADGDAADKTINIDLVADADTNFERVFVKLVAPTGGATLDAGAGIASLYISQPGAGAEVAFSDSEIATAERGFAMAVAVIERTGSAVGAVSVDYALSGGDADAGVDFQGATSGTINWADGDAEPKWLEFPVVDDGTGETDEFFELTLSNASGAAIGSQASLRINIGDGAGVNFAPNAIAGANQSVNSGATVTLNGSASNDPDGDTLTYQWAQVSGTTVSLSNATSASASFTAPTVASDTLLQFSLTVSDGQSQDTAQTSVTVLRTVNNNNNNRGGGGGSLGWILLALLSAMLVKRMLFDDRLLAVRARRNDVHRDAR